jgi:hypothetical protein
VPRSPLESALRWALWAGLVGTALGVCAMAPAFGLDWPGLVLLGPLFLPVIGLAFFLVVLWGALVCAYVRRRWGRRRPAGPSS